MSAAARAVRPTVRSMAWGPLLAAAGALPAIAVALRPWDGRPLSLSLVRLAVALAAAAAAFALDDGARVMVAASPTTLAHRRAVRVVLVVAAVTVVAGGVCLAVAGLAGTAQLPATRVLLESSGLVLAAMACAVLVGGDRGAPLFGGALLAALMVQQRFPDLALFPVAPGHPAWDRAGVAWAAIALVSAATVAALSRDPAAGRPRACRAGAGR